MTNEPSLTLTLQLDIGGEVSGQVLDYNDDVIVINYRNRPCAFAVDELLDASAYQAKKQLLIRERGGADRLTAEDHLQLGLYALRRNRGALANREFNQALRLDRDLVDRIEAAQRDFRKRKRGPKKRSLRESDAVGAAPEEPAPRSLGEVIERLDRPDRRRAIEAYKQFGRSVTQTINPNLNLIETAHFLIWTDWRKAHRGQLADWCEGMYAALACRFGLPASDNVFLGKCPVFCFRSKARFLRFARTYDNHEPAGSVGYTRTHASGHAHIAIYRRGTSGYEMDRFAGTLVHEGCHAFVHRYQRTFNISGWVGEGLANFIAQQVLGDRCLYGQMARMVARQYVLRDIPLTELLEQERAVQAHEYPIAHSLIEFLIQRDAEAFATLIGQVKTGLSIEQALGRCYAGMNLDQLNIEWRDWVGSADR